MADKIAVLRAGIVEQFGAPLEIYNNPANIFVAGFIGSPKMNFLDGEIVKTDTASFTFKSDADETFDLDARDFDVRQGQKVTLGFRPNHTKVANGADADFSVSVRSTEQLGGESFLYSNTRGGTAVTVHISGQTDVTNGAEVGLAIERSEVHVFSSETKLSQKAGLD